MKKKAIQTLISLTSKRESGFNSNNIFGYLNQLPKVNYINLKQNAKLYAQQEIENTYGIKLHQQMTKQEQETAQRLIEKIQQIRKIKSIRLAEFIQRISKRMIYGELQEAKQFLKSLDKKQVKQLQYTLDILQKVLKQRLQREQQFSQNHTVLAAQNLIQELKKTNKIDQL